MCLVPANRDHLKIIGVFLNPSIFLPKFNHLKFHPSLQLMTIMSVFADVTVIN